MRCVGEIKAPVLQHFIIDINDDEQNKFEQNWIGFYDDKRLTFEKPPYIINKETEQDKKNLVADLKDKTSKAKTVDDVKEILNSVLNNLQK